MLLRPPLGNPPPSLPQAGRIFMEEVQPKESVQVIETGDVPKTADTESNQDHRQSAVRNVVQSTVRKLSTVARTGQATALEELTKSQAELYAQLSILLAEMEDISSAVDGLTLDPATSVHMQAAKDSLTRSRTKLVTVRGRLGRLRGFEESDRLFRVQQPATELRVLASNGSGLAGQVDLQQHDLLTISGNVTPLPDGSPNLISEPLDSPLHAPSPRKAE
jgi:hypothetical protein